MAKRSKHKELIDWANTVTQCRDCGMTVAGGEYHPYAACLMYKQCHDESTVYANLRAVMEHGAVTIRGNRTPEPPATPPVDNAHVAAGCEQFTEPTGVNSDG